MKRTRKVPKEGLSIICSTKKNTIIYWNKGSIFPYRKRYRIFFQFHSDETIIPRAWNRHLMTMKLKFHAGGIKAKTKVAML